METNLIQPVNFKVAMKNLEQLPPRIEQGALRGMERGLLYTVGVAQRKFLSGPRPTRLDVRTTRLRNSVTSAAEIVPGRGVIGRIGSNVSYSRWHEFGFRGRVNVKPFTRVLGQQTSAGQSVETRGVLKDRKGNVIGKKRSFKEAAKRQRGGIVLVQFVKGHARKVNYKGRPYIRPSLEQATPAIRREINKGISEATGSETTT
ncbi:MAG: hypothetical protein SFY81_04930 [Verrucomicrobiota bacterium]|nr:hypothetical protein [Verrucomicrobiota bacterium]